MVVEVYPAQEAQQDPKACERHEFFKLLAHDDRGSRYTCAQRRAGKWVEWSVTAAHLVDAFARTGTDSYVTRNGFTGRGRKQETCRQVNALFYDLDAHGGGEEAAVQAAEAALEAAILDGRIPFPTMMVETGRGLQVYYVLERSIPCKISGGTANKKAISYYKRIEAGLAGRLESVIAPLGGKIRLDRSVFDFSRVGRVPGTLNTKSGTFAKLVSNQELYYTLDQLSGYCDAEPTPTRPSCHRQARGALSGYLRHRLEALETLQELRGFKCEGSRELMCFVHYNTAKLIFGSSVAFGMAKSFNNAFTTPLPMEEIEHIRDSVDSAVVKFGPTKGDVGYYPLSPSTVADKLSVTLEEAEATGLLSSKKKIAREAAKAKTRKNREERDALVRKLYANGYTQEEAAQAAGCCRRTVSSILKGTGIVRGQNKLKTLELAQAFLSAKERCANSCPKVVCEGSPRLGMMVGYGILAGHPGGKPLFCPEDLGCTVGKTPSSPPPRPAPEGPPARFLAVSQGLTIS